MKKVLILEAELNQAISIAKYLKKFGKFQITGAVKTDTRKSYEYYDKTAPADCLNADISNYDYIIPTGASSSYKMLKRYKRLNYNNGIKLTDTNLIVYDKNKMLKIAQNLNIPVPKTAYSKDEIESFPVFYKESFEKGGGVRGIAKSKKELPKYDGLIYQEYINTPATYGVGFLADEGKILTFLIHKEVISYPVSGGSAVVIEKFYDKRLLEYTQKLLKKIDYSGWGLAEFKYCKKRDDFVFMEINGKLWSSIEFMFLNNFEFLNILFDIDYKIKTEKRVLFINRLLKYDKIDIFKNLKYIFTSHIVAESSVVYQVVRKLIPDSLVNLIKRLKSVKS